MAYGRRQRNDISWKLGLISQILPMLGDAYSFTDKLLSKRNDKRAYDEFIAQNTAQPTVTPGARNIISPLPLFNQDSGGAGMLTDVSRGTAPSAPPGMPPGGIGPLPPVQMDDVPALRPITDVPRQGGMALPEIAYNPGGGMQQLTVEDLAELYGQLSGSDSPQWKQAEMLFSGQQTERARTDDQARQTKADAAEQRRIAREDRADVRENEAAQASRVDRQLKLLGDLGLKLNPALGLSGLRAATQALTGGQNITEIDGVPIVVPGEDYMPGSVQYVTGDDGSMAVTYLTRDGKQKTIPVEGMKYKAGTKPKPRGGGGATKAKKSKLEDLI